MTPGPKADLLVDCRNILGEAVQWNMALQRVFWTDIFGNALWSCDENGDDIVCLDLPGSLCAFAFSQNGGMIAAFADGLYDLDPSTGHRRLLATYQPELGSRTRMNDGGLDRQGRFLVGGIDEEGMHPITDVWSVSESGVQPVLSGVGCANSIAFSPEGDTMYFADSRRRDIFAYQYDRATGTPGEKRRFATLGEGEGSPDGSCVDSEGALWNAQFGGGAVQRFLQTGERHIRVELGVPNVTCCCLGGRNLDLLFVTTASAGMDKAALKKWPWAGGLFVCQVETKGLKPLIFPAYQDSEWQLRSHAGQFAGKRERPITPG